MRTSRRESYPRGAILLSPFAFWERGDSPLIPSFRGGTMSRQPRVTIPEYPHHVTNRGNRRADIFLDDIDRYVYIKKLITRCIEESVRIWAWCLMINHIHLIAVPK